jgi:hypothetical protein
MLSYPIHPPHPSLSTSNLLLPALARRVDTGADLEDILLISPVHTSVLTGGSAEIVIVVVKVTVTVMVISHSVDDVMISRFCSGVMRILGVDGKSSGVVGVEVDWDGNGDGDVDVGVSVVPDNPLDVELERNAGVGVEEVESEDLDVRPIKEVPGSNAIDGAFETGAARLPELLPTITPLSCSAFV